MWATGIASGLQEGKYCRMSLGQSKGYAAGGLTITHWPGLCGTPSSAPHTHCLSKVSAPLKMLLSKPCSRCAVSRVQKVTTEQHHAQQTWKQGFLQGHQHISSREEVEQTSSALRQVVTLFVMATEKMYKYVCPQAKPGEALPHKRLSDRQRPHSEDKRAQHTAQLLHVMTYMTHCCCT